MEELLPNKDFASLGEDLRPGVHVAVKLVNWTLLAGGSGQCMVGSTDGHSGHTVDSAGQRQV